jgi:hypothetical protein
VFDYGLPDSHFLAFYQSTNPFDAFFVRDAEDYQPSPPLPGGPIFLLLHIGVLGYIIALDLTPRKFVALNLPLLSPYTHRIPYALTAVVPVLCLFSGQNLVNIVWSAFALFIVTVNGFIRRMVSRSDDNLKELERSKYTAKGA